MDSVNGERPDKHATPGFFEDMRVVEVGSEAVDFCGMLLAGEGAGVIKVEPTEGSPSRRIGPFFEDVPGKNRSLFYWAYNRGKRGVTIDMQSDAGKRRYRELVRAADVVIDAQPMGLMNSLGLGYEAVKEMHPAAVYCSITPFGSYGPWKDFKSSDLIHQALGGSAYCIGYSSTGAGKWDTPPFMAQSWHSFAITAAHAAVAIAAAFYHGRQTGRGQFIDVSIHDACAQGTEGTVPRYIYGKRNQVRSTPQQVMCADGRFIALVIVMLRVVNVSKLRELVRPEGLADALADPRLQDADYMNTSEASELIFSTIGKWAKTKTAVVAFQALQECNVVCAPNRPPEELPADPHFLERDNFVNIEHPELGRSFIYPRRPSIRSEAAWRWGPRAPLLGEHNDQVWRELSARSEPEQAADA